MKEKILAIISHYGYSSVVAHTPNDAACVEDPVWITPDSDIEKMLAQGYTFRANYRDNDSDIESFDLTDNARITRMRQCMGWSVRQLSEKSGMTYNSMRKALAPRSRPTSMWMKLTLEVYEQMYRMHYFGD